MPASSVAEPRVARLLALWPVAAREQRSALGWVPEPVRRVPRRQVRKISSIPLKQGCPSPQGRLWRSTKANPNRWAEGGGERAPAQACLYLLALPAAPFKKNDADRGDEAFCDDDGPEDALGLLADVDRQEVG